MDQGVELLHCTPTHFPRVVQQGRGCRVAHANESHFCHEFKRVYQVSPQSFAPRYKYTHGALRPAPNMSCLDKNVVLRQSFLLVGTNANDKNITVAEGKSSLDF